MEIIKAEIPGLLLIKPDVYKDSRGIFYESFNQFKFAEKDLPFEFVQDNISISSKNTLRGLHFQTEPHAQGKLVSVIKGAALDVAVDLRKNSSFFGKYYLAELNDQNNLLFWIPPGFAHGFLAMEDQTIFSYKCSSAYNKNAECSIRWNDRDINIQWGISSPLLSDKDATAPYLNDILGKL